MFIVTETPPSLPQQSKTQEKGRRMLNKKLYVLIASVTAIAVVLVALFIPQGAAIIPLEVNYTVGERMVYDTIQQMTTLNYSTPAPHLGGGPPNTTISQTTTVEVTDFDGQYYTLNRTTKILSSTSPTNSTTLPLTQKINKQGYTITIYQGTEISGNGTQNPFITEILNRSDVRVGDTWTVPITHVTPTSSYSGSMRLTFQGIEDITVPAGTFRVFRVNSESNTTLQTNPIVRDFTTSTTVMTISQNGTMYMEYSTCRQIKSTVQQIQVAQTLTTTGNVTLPASSYTMLMISNTELVQDILP